MKNFKFMIVAFMAMIFGTAFAQHTTKSYLTDNVFVSVNGGVISPLNHTFDVANHGLKNERFDWGVEFGKWITPEIGLSIAGNANVNTEGIHTVFDASNVVANLNVNVLNLLCGYNGEPRRFEIVAKPGVGWAHIYGNDGPNALTYNTALDLGWNLGKKKAWKVSVVPSVVWRTLNVARTQQRVGFDSRRAAFVLHAGVTYTFRGHNNKHYFTNCDKVYTVDEYDMLQDELYRTKAEVVNLASALKDCEKNLKEAERLLSDTTEVEEVYVDTLGYFIFFDKGKTLVTKEMRPQVKVLAEYINSTPSVLYDIVGYADNATGKTAYNQKISEERAKNVVEMLKGYGVDGSRLTAIGKGDTEQPFNGVEANRVVLTISK